MKRIFINQDILFGFRVPVLNALSKKAEISVYAKQYSKKIDREFDFGFNLVRSVGKRVIFQCINPFVVKEYDVVILIFDTRIISNLMLHFFCKIFGVPVIYWGIGYGQRAFSNYFRDVILRTADALILYNEGAKKVFREKHKNIPIYVCNNTVESTSFKVDVKTKLTGNFLFVGALEKRKGLLELLEELSLKTERFDKFYIIGDGPERGAIKSFIVESGLSHKVELVGSLQNYKQLYSYYKLVDFSISLRQAGLSVQQSMLFATPFVCYEDCISGGEIQAIEDGGNGFMLGETKKLHDFSAFLDKYATFTNSLVSSFSCSALNTYQTRFSDQAMERVIEDACSRVSNV